MSKGFAKKKAAKELMALETSPTQKTIQKHGLSGIAVVGKTEGQKKALETIRNYDISILSGQAGTGKTWMATGMGLSYLLQGKVDRLILTRPYVEAGEHLGYLPGSFNSKIAPFMYPIMDIASQFIGIQAVTAFIEQGNIQVTPLAYMRGMAQPLDSLIVNQKGYIKMRDLNVGDTIMGKKGTPIKVTGIYPQGIKKVYRIDFSDGVSTECCGDHLWGVKKLHNKRKGRRKELSIIKTIDMIPNVRTNHGVCMYEIPLTDPVEFYSQKITIDPYLLGLLLGDGCLHPSASITFSTSDDDLLESIRKILPENMAMRWASNYDYRLITTKPSRCGNPLKRQLKDLDLIGKESDTKFIPDVYKFNTKEVRLAVLQGLMDTDGSIFSHTSNSKKFRMQYYSTSNQLAEDVVFLVQSLGGIAHKTLRPPNTTPKRLKNGHCVYSKLDIWVIDIVLDKMNPFRLKRKADKYNSSRSKRLITKITEIGEKECQCISVDSDDHLYLTNDFIVTHNTFTNSFIVADEFQNATIAQTRLLLTRIGANSRMVITGDTEQSDLNSRNGLTDAVKRLKDLKEIGFAELGEEDCVRSPIVAKIDKLYRQS